VWLVVFAVWTHLSHVVGALAEELDIMKYFFLKILKLPKIHLLMFFSLSFAGFVS